MVLVLESRVLRIIFGSKRDEVTWEWRKLHNEEINDLRSLPNIITMIKSRRMKWTEHTASLGRGEERCIQGFGGKPKEKKPLVRPRRRWEYHIKMDFQ
jgi:hypothetical protein